MAYDWVDKLVSKPLAKSGSSKPIPTPVPTPAPRVQPKVTTPKTSLPKISTSLSLPMAGMDSKVSSSASMKSKTSKVSPVDQGVNLIKSGIKASAPIVDKVKSAIGETPIPFTNNMVKAKNVAPVVTGAIRAPFRQFKAAELSLTGQKEYNPVETKYNPLTKKVDKVVDNSFIYGKEPIKSYSEQTKDTSNFLQNPEVGGVKSPVKLDRNVANIAAVPIVAGLTALDLTPGVGGGKKEVAKETMNLVRGAKTLDEFISLFSKAKPEIKALVETGIKDKNVAFNSLEEFYSFAKNLDVPKSSTKLLGAGDPEQRAIEAIKNATPIRAEQEALYTAERAQRINKAVEASKAVGGGQAGYYAKLNALSGEMPKVQFESLSKQVSQSDVDFLFNKIDQSPVLTDFEKLPAQKALEKLFRAEGATVPTEGELKMLSQVFKPELIKAILDTRPISKKIYDTAVDVLNVPRSIMSSGDFSAPLRQGIVPAATHPRDFMRSVKNMFSYAVNQKSYEKLFKDIQARPTYQIMKDNGLAISDMAVPSSREEAFMSGLAERIPVLGRLIKSSDRAYTGFLTSFRADLFDTIYDGGKNLGKGNDQKYLKDLASFINTATGRGDLASIPGVGSQLSDAAPLLNGMFFSPRLIASRFSLLNPVSYAKMDPTVRKEAMKTMAIFIGTGMSIIGAAKLAGANVSTEPTSSDFGKIRIGNTRYDIWGGFQPYVTFFSRMISGKYTSTTTGESKTYGEGYKGKTRLDAAYQFMEGKASPVASFTADALRGKDFEQNKFNLAELDPTKNPIAKRILPMMVADFKDTWEQYGSIGPIVSLPGMFGVGTSTYGAKKPKKAPKLPTSITPKLPKKIGSYSTD